MQKKFLKKHLSKQNLIIIVGCAAVLILLIILMSVNRGKLSGNSYRFTDYDKYVKISDYKNLTYKTNKKVL